MKKETKKEKAQKKEKGTAGKKIRKIFFLLIVLALALGFAVATDMLEELQGLTASVQFSVEKIVTLVVMIAMVMIIANLLQLILKSIHPKAPRAATIVTIISSLVQYAAAIIVLCWGMTILGISVEAIFASVGLVALIVGFGAESLIEDVITGLFMIFENQYNVNDIIEVEGFRGTVKRMGIRTTVIADSSDNEKIINNSLIKNVLNRSTSVSKAVCDISIAYEEDLEKVEELIAEAAKGVKERNAEIFNNVPRYVGVQELGVSGVILRIVAEVKECDIYSACRIMNREFFLAFKKAGVTIPYPQVDVHSK